MTASSSASTRHCRAARLMAGRTSLTVYEGMTGMSENVFINLKNKSHTITADVEIPQAAPTA